MSRRVLIALIALGAIWGSSYLFIDIALRGFDPAVVAWGRQALGALVLLPFALFRGQLRLSGDHVGWVVVVALVMVGGPTVLIAVGQQSVSPALAGILVSTTPVLTALIAICARSVERPTIIQMAGVGLGFLGVILLFGVDLREDRALTGGLLLMLASLGYAAGGWLVKLKVANTPPLGLAAMASAVSAIVLLPVAASRFRISEPTLGSTLSIVELGVVGTGIGWVMYYALIARSGPQQASLAMYLAPVFAAVLGFTLADDPLTWSVLIGLLTVVLGSWFAAWRPSVQQPLAPPPA